MTLGLMHTLLQCRCLKYEGATKGKVTTLERYLLSKQNSGDREERVHDSSEREEREQQTTPTDSKSEL